MTGSAVVVSGGLDGSLMGQVDQVIDSIDISETSRRQYKREVLPFLKWLGPSQLHPNILLDYERFLQSRTDVGTGTKSKYLTVARVFLRELYRLRVIPLDVTAGIRSFRMTRPHKKSPITDDEIQRLWEYLDSEEADPRVRVIIGLMYFQGLRRVEVGRLRIEDFNSGTKTLLVWGKGRDDKEIVDCHPRMVTILGEYLSCTRLKSGPLFPSRQKGNGESISSNMIYRLVMKVHRQLGIAKNVHGYRKVFTSKLIESGLNLLEVRSYTRHRDVSQLQVYYDRLDKSKTLPTYYATFESKHARHGSRPYEDSDIPVNGPRLCFTPFFSF
jgi:integrase